MESKTKKGIIAALFIGAIGYLAYKAFKKPDTPPVGGGGTGTPPPPPPVGGGSSLDFTALANKLFDAFNGCTTKNDVWRDVLTQLQKQADWDALSAAYGTKKLTCWTDFWNNGTFDLVQSFKSA